MGTDHRRPAGRFTFNDEASTAAAALDLLVRPDWHARAACRAADVDPAWFFPRRGQTWAVERAKAVCAGCPVVDECREDALRHEPEHLVGIWGGWSGRQRKQAIRNGRPLPATAWTVTAQPHRTQEARADEDQVLQTLAGNQVTTTDVAVDLGWPRERVSRTIRRLVRAGRVREAAREKRRGVTVCLWADAGRT